MRGAGNCDGSADRSLAALTHDHVHEESPRLGEDADNEHCACRVLDCGRQKRVVQKQDLSIIASAFIAPPREWPNATCEPRMPAALQQDATHHMLRTCTIMD